MTNQDESPEVKIAALALNLWFAGQAISVFMRPTESAGLGEWMTSVAAVVMVLAGLLRCLSNWHMLPAAAQHFVIIGTVLLVPMTLMGVVGGLDDPLYTMLKALPWYAAVFLPALGVPRLPPVFITIFRWHALLGVALTTYVLATNWSLISASSVKREETLAIKVVQFVLYSLFFQLFRIGAESWLHRLVALAGLAQMLIIAFGSGTRQSLVLIVIVVVIAIVVTMRSVHGMAGAGAGRKVAVVFAACCFLAATVVYIFSSLQGAVDLLNKRMSAQNEGTSLRENARIFEIKELIEQFGPIDYVFGRGIVGEFSNSAAPKQDNVHIGWFRVLLKGGVPLVLYFAVMYAMLGFRRLATSRDGVVLACAAIVTFFAFKNATGNIILANGHFYIVALCLGSLFAPDDAFSRHQPRPLPHR